MSHASLSVVRHLPTSNVVLKQDTINFGNVNLTHCAYEWLHIRNEGEAPLILDSTIFSPHQFSLEQGRDTILGYTTDSILIKFCPDTAGKFAGSLLLYSNDTSDGPRKVVLVGRGLQRKDSLLVISSPVDFGKVKI